NVITNASEAIGDTVGTINLKTGEMHADREYLAATYMDDGLDAGKYVFLEVADTGCGMKTETLAKIFDPFFTTKFTGRGLGLAAALGIVRGHAGALKVTSVVGRGTLFRILFPFSGRALAKANEPPGSHRLNVRRSGCVLVVDDEEMVRKVAAATLEAVGYSVLTASDGRDAVDLFRRRGDEIDAVLLDMTMPRMGGEEACREIRRLRADAKIIVASGFSEQEAAQRFAGEDVDGFLQKPFRPNALVGQVEKLLAKKPSP
ncbi:MAG: response regulator, partial [Thermoanaerobaculia bacterium]